ncbi:hypothetical protein TRIUR3_33950 [Triticum urartu]|uniref:Uncharacterized protein n=1 Tax=Triticum urartu TaxID=4572 RepID=M7YRL9_TRIUA|nr:hypothetical protein TRIUR3_33950 [Triticum urartu]
MVLNITTMKLPLLRQGMVDYLFLGHYLSLFLSSGPDFMVRMVLEELVGILETVDPQQPSLEA